MQDRLTRSQLINLVQRIMDAAGTEDEIDAWIGILESNVPHPEVTDLIFYSEPKLTAEEVVEKALAYRATPLPGPGPRE